MCYLRCHGRYCNNVTVKMSLFISKHYNCYAYAQGLVGDLKSAMDTLDYNLELLEQTMENLAETVAELEDFLLIAEYIMASTSVYILKRTLTCNCSMKF